MEFSLIRSDRGAFLLEASIAVAIIAVAMSGLAISLTRCADASLMLGKESRLRTALENRLAELSAENLPTGTNTLVVANGAITIEQNVQFASVRGRTKELLTGLYEIHLKAAFANDAWPPLQTTRLIYKP